jgi:lipopolysaccharide transport system permease protein
MGHAPQWQSWVWSIGLLVLGFAFAQFLMRRTRNRVPYWL